MRSLTVANLRRWGGKLELVRPDGISVCRAILEPVTSQAWQNMRREMRDLGELPTGQYVYIGEEDLSRVAFLRRGKDCFMPRRCEAVRLGDTVLFYWGLAVPVGEEDAWNK